MNKLQNKLKDMLKEIIECFEKAGIQYSAAFGTLIGVIRHKGFIPWDDDIDLLMSKPMYDKLIMNAKEILPDYYELEHMTVDGEHPYNFVKIYDKRTTLVERFYKKRVVKGIYIDIIPLIPVPKNYKKFISKVTYLGRIKKVKEKLFYKNKKSVLLYYLFYIPVNMFYSRKKLFKRILDLENEVYEKHTYVFPFFEDPGINELYETEWFDKLIDAPFEDIKIKIPTRYHEILTKTYGDYMKVPKEEDRVQHVQNEFLDLELPYEKYLKD